MVLPTHLDTSMGNLSAERYGGRFIPVHLMIHETGSESSTSGCRRKEELTVDELDLAGTNLIRRVEMTLSSCGP